MNRYVFCTNFAIASTKISSRFKVIVKTGKTVEEAYNQALIEVPEGYEIWTWHEIEPVCNVCHGPWHPATGHAESETMLWCGPCTRRFISFLKGHLNRRWGGMAFYESNSSP